MQQGTLRIEKLGLYQKRMPLYQLNEARSHSEQIYVRTAKKKLCRTEVLFQKENLLTKNQTFTF